MRYQCDILLCKATFYELDWWGSGNGADWFVWIGYFSGYNYFCKFIVLGQVWKEVLDVGWWDNCRGKFVWGFHLYWCARYGPKCSRFLYFLAFVWIQYIFRTDRMPLCILNHAGYQSDYRLDVVLDTCGRNVLWYAYQIARNRWDFLNIWSDFLKLFSLLLEINDRIQRVEQGSTLIKVRFWRTM